MNTERLARGGAIKIDQATKMRAVKQRIKTEQARGCQRAAANVVLVAVILLLIAGAAVALSKPRPTPKVEVAR